MFLRNSNPHFRFINQFAQNRRGNVAIIMAIVATPMIALVGGGLDYMGASNAELRLRQIVDGAAFVAAKAAVENDSERTAIAESFIADNLPTNFENLPLSVEITSTGDTFEAHATLDWDNNFLGVIGRPVFDISVSSTVERVAGRPLEMVLAMDTTNSMKSISGGWDDAVSRIKRVLAQTINDMDSDVAKNVSVMPFTDRVNIGTARSSWLDGAAPASWNGCVEPREETVGSFAYALDDDTFQDEAFIASIPGVTGGLATRGGGYPHCPPAITGPTDDLNVLDGAMDSLSAQGTGRFDEALAWGWRLLSPKWQGRWDSTNYPLNSDEAEKVLAIFTDGHTRAYHFETVPSRLAGSYNHLTPEAGDLLVDLCSRIIADGINLFVFYINGSVDSRTYFERCTNDSSRFFEIDGTAALGAALETMATRGSFRLIN